MQLAGDLQVERPVPRHHDPPPRQHAVAAQQGLRGARGHHAGQGPARHRQRPLEGPGRHDQLPWPDRAAALAVVHQDRERQRCRPDRAVHHRHAGGAHARDQPPPRRELRIVERLGERRQRLLEVLAARGRPLVDQHDLDAGLRGNRGGGQAAGPGADHQQLRREGRPFGRVRDARVPAVVEPGREALRADGQRPVDLGHAGALVRPAVDLDQAVLADAHAAEQAAWRATAGRAQGGDAGRRQGRGQGLAAPGGQRAAVEGDRDRLAGRDPARARPHRPASCRARRARAPAGGPSASGRARPRVRAQSVEIELLPPGRDHFGDQLGAPRLRAARAPHPSGHRPAPSVRAWAAMPPRVFRSTVSNGPTTDQRRPSPSRTRRSMSATLATPSRTSA